MYKAVLSIVRQHETIWSGTPMIVDSVNRLENSLISLKEKESVQGSVTLGVSQARNEFFEKVAEKMIILNDALWVYAKATNQFELQARNSHSPSRIKTLSNTARLVQMDVLLKDLENHEAALSYYGVTPDSIANFVAMVNEYQLISLNPRMSVVSRKSITEEISKGISEIHGIVQMLDRLIRSLAEQDPKFVLDYFNARIVIGTNGKRYPKKGSTPNDPNDGSVE
jgi:hypothetical protein